MNTWRHARRAVAVRLDEPTLIRFIVLSLLLHVGFVLLFGSTTGGGARRDLAPGDIFDVTLRQRIDESGASFRWTPGASDSTSGSALLPRERAAQRPPPQAPRETRPTPVPPRANEGAAERAQPAAAPEAPVPEIIDAASRAAPAVVLPAEEPLQRFNPDAQETVDKPYVPTPVPPPAPAPAPPAAVVPVPREVRPAPAPAPQDVAPAVAPAARPAPEAAPAVEREIAPPPARREAPITERSDLPAEPAPRADAPRASPIEPTPPLPTPRTAPPAIEREAQPPVEKTAPRTPPIEPVPRSEPIAAPPAREPVASPPPVRETVPAVSPPAPAIAEPIAPREQRIVPSSTPAAPSVSVTPAAPPARSEPAPAASPRLRFGEPAPDEDMFKPRRDAAPAAEPGTVPKLDLDEAKRRAARDIVREGSGSRGLLSVVPPPPERESKEARALEKAAKPDCRTAYANLGLVAVVPLVTSAISNSGCRW